MTTRGSEIADTRSSTTHVDCLLYVLYHLNVISRRYFLSALAAPVLAQPQERIIDIHQHTSYAGRSDADLITHQKQMGVTQTVLLPWIAQPLLPDGSSRYGLPGQPGGDDSVVALSRAHPKQ